ncbi:MAG: SusD/RagB family nutrient-binding outer membrane lipoprotein, partial [Bacteroidota bacterium]
MRNIYITKFAAGAALALAITSMPACTKHFDTININPDAVSSPTPQYVFTKAQYDGAGYGDGPYGSSSLDLLLGTMQYTTSYNDVAGFGSKYNANQVTQSAAAFSAAYPDEINELGIVIKAVKNNAAQVNLLAAARIWRVYCFSRLTDLYGDIPYSQAGLGYDSSLYKPAYDAQKDIYANMLSELDAAAQSFDAAKGTFGAADLIYSGNIPQWKKFAYSLMLRLGMRLTKVDITAAQAWVTKAIAGGVITQDADIAKMPYLNAGQVINLNPTVYNMWNADYHFQDGVSNPEGGKYQQSWIDSLKAHNDPRLPVISVVFIGGVPDTTSAKQLGMPATFV